MMHAGNNRTVTVNRLKLIEQLKLNLYQHRQDFEEAVIGYKIKLISDLEFKLASVKSLTPKKLQDLEAVKFAFPPNFEREYVDAITMLDWSVSDTVELDQTSFKQYVQNEWSWSRGFDVTNNLYKSIAASAMPE
jgi:hypothetical protein